MVTFGWIVFDAAISVRMMIGGYSFWECVAWFAFGLVLAGVAWVAEYRADKKHDADTSWLREELAEHKGLLRGLGIANAGTLKTVLDVKDARIERLAETVEGLTGRIALSESERAQLDAFKSRQWKPLTPELKSALVEKLKALPAEVEGRSLRRIDIRREELPDCIDLADDLGDCFRRAGWEMAWEPRLKEDLFPGICVSAGPIDPRVPLLATALTEALGANYGTIQTRTVSVLGPRPSGWQLNPIRRAAGLPGVLGTINALMVVEIAIGRKERI